MSSTQRTLDGRTALVTGATSGIGRAAAVQLAREGAEVIVHGRDADRGEQVVTEIAREGGKARFIAADLSELARLSNAASPTGQTTGETMDRCTRSPCVTSPPASFWVGANSVNVSTAAPWCPTGPGRLTAAAGCPGRGNER